MGQCLVLCDYKSAEINISADKHCDQITEGWTYNENTTTKKFKTHKIRRTRTINTFRAEIFASGNERICKEITSKGRY